MKRFLLAFSAITLAACWATSAHALIMNVSQAGASSAGGNAGQIAAPSDALDATVTNNAMQGFNEAQNVTISMAYSTDQGNLTIGDTVDSHMIFLNKAQGVSGTLSHTNVTWTFSGAILGVMSDTPGDDEADSTIELGHSLTNYPNGFPFRGLEGNNGGVNPGDGYTIVNGNELIVAMAVTQPGDWIRVVTVAAPVPEPGTILLLGSGLAGLGFWRWKKG